MLGNYSFKDDVEKCCDILDISKKEFANKAGAKFRTLQEALDGTPNSEILEKTYNAFYKLGIRLNVAKTEVYQENLSPSQILLFHGSRNGIDDINPDGARDNCDFGRGFYCSEKLSSALNFVETESSPSVYVFIGSLVRLKTINIPASIEWLLTVCYHRRQLNRYQNHPKLKETLARLEGVDVIIAPIADNRMYQIMRRFADGQITDKEAIHALSASRLGNQYVFKTSAAINSLHYQERLYVCEEERLTSLRESEERSKEIETKLKWAQRNFRGTGLYIDQVLS